MSTYESLSEKLQSHLGLAHPPIAITFCDSVPSEVPDLSVLTTLNRQKMAELAQLLQDAYSGLRQVKQLSQPNLRITVTAALAV